MTSRASSATAGFFQSLPNIPPQYTAPTYLSSPSHQSKSQDLAFEQILSLYLPSPLPLQIQRSLHDFARKCLHPETLRLCIDAELNPPRLNPLNTFGEENRKDALWTSEGWRALKAIGIEGGTVSLAYSQISDPAPGTGNPRIHQFANAYLFAGSAALVTCPAAMTDGAASLLSRHLQDPDGDQPGRASILAAARERLIESDAEKAWTSGQWMTERTGGSDVSLTETLAVRLDVQQIEDDTRVFGSSRDAVGMPLGPWQVDGFKWFSSATDSDMVILLAGTSKGLSVFYAPMRRMTSSGGPVMNGVRITRLKDKLGTKALPTAELEIKGMRAWMIGEEGKGVKEISSILNLTRLWTAVGAVGGWARGLAVARAYSGVRSVKNRLLQDNPQHLAWMGGEFVKHRAACHLVFFGVALQGISEQSTLAVRDTKAQPFLPSTSTEAAALLRILTPVMKAQCSLAAVAGLRECMESLGGVGYCENNHDGGVMNIARIFRDTNVNCIWEGTTSVMAEDLVRALKDNRGDSPIEVVNRQVRRLLQFCGDKFNEECKVVDAAWESFMTSVISRGTEELLFKGRDLLQKLESILCACLLMCSAHDCGDFASVQVARRWISSNLGRIEAAHELGWREQAILDREIFLNIAQDTLETRSNL